MQQRAGGRPLDPEGPIPENERPASDPASAADSGSAPAPGLIAQAKATKDAVLGLLRAHIALGRAEADVIKGEIAYTAAFLGMAVGAVLLLGVFLPIATLLFLGEWLFGSIGWGLLLGTELLVAVAATAVNAGLKLRRPAPALAVGLLAGVVALIVLGASWPNRLWTLIGDNASLAIDPAYRPLAIGVAVVAVVLAIVGLLAGAKAAGFGGAIAGLVGGAILGALVGAFLTIDFGWRVGAALGVAVFFVVYLGVLGARAVAAGVDAEQLKLRFWPQQTIDTTKETLEWAKARNPLAPKS